MTTAEEKKLADAQSVTRKFFENAKDLFGAQLKNLEAIQNDMQLPEAPAEEAEPAEEDDLDVDEAVHAIEQQVSRPAAPEPDLDLDLSDFDIAPAPKRRNLGSTQSFNL